MWKFLCQSDAPATPPPSVGASGFLSQHQVDAMPGPARQPTSSTSEQTHRCTSEHITEHSLTRDCHAPDGASHEHITGRPVSAAVIANYAPTSTSQQRGAALCHTTHGQPTTRQPTTRQPIGSPLDIEVSVQGRSNGDSQSVVQGRTREEDPPSLFSLCTDSDADVCGAAVKLQASSSSQSQSTLGCSSSSSPGLSRVTSADVIVPQQEVSFSHSADRFCSDTGAGTGPDDVVLSFESLPNSQAKALVWFQRAGVVAALTAMSVLLYSKLSLDFRSYQPTSDRIQVWNIVMACVLLAMLVPCMLRVDMCSLTVWRQRGTWSHRRWRIFIVSIAIISVQFISLALYLAANVVLLTDCAVLTKYKTNVVLYGLQSTLLVVIIVLLLIQAQNKVPLHCQFHSMAWRWCKRMWRWCKGMWIKVRGVKEPCGVPEDQPKVCDVKEPCSGPEDQATVCDVKEPCSGPEDQPKVLGEKEPCSGPDDQPKEPCGGPEDLPQVLGAKEPCGKPENQPDMQKLMMDASMWRHWFKFLLCLGAEAMVLMTAMCIAQQMQEFIAKGGDFILDQCDMAEALLPVYDDPDAFWCPEAQQLGLNISVWDPDYTWRNHENGHTLLLDMNITHTLSTYCARQVSIVDSACSLESASNFSVLLFGNSYITWSMGFYVNQSSKLLGTPCEQALNNSVDLGAQLEGDSLRWEDRREAFYSLLRQEELDRGDILLTNADTADLSSNAMPNLIRDILIMRASFASWNASSNQELLRLSLIFGWVLYVMYIAIAMRSLKQLPYIPYRTGHVLLRWEVRTTFFLFFTMNLAWVLLWQVASDRYGATAMMGSVGVWMPLEIAKTFLAVELCVLYTPRLFKTLHNPLQVQLQRFAWTEGADHQNWKQLLLALRERNASVKSLHQRKPSAKALQVKEEVVVPRDTPRPSVGAGPPESAVFCFETALKAFMWTCLAYECHRTEEHSKLLLTLALTMSKYGKVEKIHHAGRDTAVVMSWGCNGLVIAFRGTATLRNALTDLQGWQTGIALEAEDQPHQGSFTGYFQRVSSFLSRRLLCTNFHQPGVHAGFWKSWQVVKGEVLGVLSQALDSMDPHGTTTFDVLLTGHSMGGALCVVAGRDILSHLHQHNASRKRAVEWKLRCYTFGAPRVTNNKFAQLCNKLIPDTWHIINDQDIIPRLDSLTKFMVPYKRTGHQVIINGRGDMIVRPSFPERAMWTQPFMTKQSVKHHYLKDGNSGYAASLGSVIAAQLRGTGFEDGEEGIQELLGRCPAMRQAVMLTLPQSALQVEDPESQFITPAVQVPGETTHKAHTRGKLP